MEAAKSQAKDDEEVKAGRAMKWPELEDGLPSSYKMKVEACLQKRGESLKASVNSCVQNKTQCHGL